MPHSFPPFLPDGREDTKLNLAVETLRDRNTVRLRAWGTSMLPSVWPGDLLTIESAAYDEVIPGDIVLVLRNQRPFIHRLIQKRMTEDCISWITRGDAMPHNDPPIAATELLGRVTCVGRGNRSFVPSRQVSQLNFAVGWTLFRYQRFLSLIFKMKSAPLETLAIRNVRNAMPRISSPGATPR
jgi:signal peptidase I